MPNVFAKNTTSASITVAGHKVYYIDSADAEIVEVEDGNNVKYNAFKYTLSGTPYYYVIDGEHDTWTDDLSAWGYSEVPVGPVPVGPSVGDIITLGKYPQATSTPEDIEWVVLAVDTANHRALLVSKYALTARQFDVYRQFSGNYWNSSTLRTWLNGDFWNAAFTVYEQAAIILSDLDTNGTATQDHVFILAISDANDYFSSNSDRLCIATQYAINQNIYNTPTEHYAPWWLRTKDSTTRNDYAAFVESDGAVHADGYSATDTHFGIRPAIWFDYTVVVLPTVSGPYWLAPDTASGSSTVQPNGLQSCVDSLSTHEQVVFNSSMSYGVSYWKNPDNTLGGHVEFSIANVNGYVGIRNVSDRTINVYWVNYAVCSDSTATVVTVYNASNVAYNAFKFTANNTEYYYVLDGTQTDWTDDLAGIGYSLTPAPLNGYFDSGGSSGSGIVYQGGYVDVYDASGNLVNYESGKTYTCLGVYHTGGEISGMAARALFGQSSGKLRFSLDGVTHIQNIFRIEYTVS